MSDKSPLQNCKEPDDRPEKLDLAEQNLKQVFVHVMRRSSIYKSDFWYKTEPRMCYINKNLPDYCIKKEEGFKKPTRNINHILDQFSLASPINPGSSNYSRSFKTFFISDWMIQFVYKFSSTVATLYHRIYVSPWELGNICYTQINQSLQFLKSLPL